MTGFLVRNCLLLTPHPSRMAGSGESDESDDGEVLPSSLTKS